MEILEIIIPIAAIFNFFLGFFVLIKDPSKKLNLFFGISCFVTSIWIFANFMMGVRQTLFWLESASAFGALVPFTALLWILELCEKRLSGKSLILLGGLALFFFVVSYTELITTDIKEIHFGRFEGKTGPLFPLYSVYVSGVLLFILYVFIEGYLKASGIKKLQLSYVMIGGILYMSSASIVTLIFPLFGIYRFAFLDTPSSLFLLFFTALAITRYHLFGIEVILTEILVLVIGILLLIQIFVAPTIFWKIINGTIFLLFCIFGYLLIRGVFREIKRREEVERIAQQEKALREKAEKLAEEFQHLDRLKNQFILTTQHHLRTPLSIIKGYLATILGGIYGEIKNQKINQALKNTLQATQRLITLVNEFLDISQFQLGKGALKKEEINLKDVLNETVEELRPEAEKKKLYLKMIFKTEDLKLKADFQRLKEAFFNLIDNAIKYTQKGGIEIKVESKSPESLLVSIKDTGIGMSKETLSKIFKGLFERGKEAEKVELTGKGIGLFISKVIVDAHKGKIWAESEGPGKGSTFFVELPRK